MLTAVRNAIYSAGPLGALARRAWPRAAILAYHRVAEAPLDPFGQAVSPATFERQLRHVLARYRVMPLEAMLDDVLAGRVPDRALSITFDDGYADTLHAAAPIASVVGVPITVFVTVQPMLDRQPFWWDALTSLVLRAHPGVRSLDVAPIGAVDMATDKTRHATLRRLQGVFRRMPAAERSTALDALRGAIGDVDGADLGRPLTVEELGELAGTTGVSIGAHTMTHPALSALGAGAQLEELSRSRRTLQELTRRDITTLAYPFGKRDDVSAATMAAARTAGFRAAVTTRGGAVVRSSQRFAIPRITAHDWDDAAFDRRLRAALAEAVE